MDTKASFMICWDISTWLPTASNARTPGCTNNTRSIFSLVERRRKNSAWSDGIKQLPTHAIGSWVWVYTTASTIRQGAKAGTGAKVLKK